MAIGIIYLWLYVYNILRISSKEVNVNIGSEAKTELSEETLVTVTGIECDISSLETPANSHSASSSSKFMVVSSYKIGRCLKTTSKRMKLKELLAPSTIGAIVGFFIGMISPFRKLLIGDDAPLHAVGDTVSKLANNNTSIRSRTERVFSDHAMDVCIDTCGPYTLVHTLSLACSSSLLKTLYRNRCMIETRHMYYKRGKVQYRNQDSWSLLV